MSYLPNITRKFRKELVKTGETVSMNKVVEMTPTGIRECKKTVSDEPVNNTVDRLKLSTGAYVQPTEGYGRSATLKLGSTTFVFTCDDTNIRYVYSLNNGVSYNDSTFVLAYTGVAISHFEVKKLSETKILVSYREGNSIRIHSAIFTLSGYSFSNVSSFDVATSVGYYFSTIIKEYSTNNFKLYFLYHNNSSDEIRLREYDFNSSNTLTFLAETVLQTFKYGNSLGIRLLQLSDDIYATLTDTGSYRLYYTVFDVVNKSLKCQLELPAGIYNYSGDIDWIRMSTDKITLLYRNSSTRYLQSVVLHINPSTNYSIDNYTYYTLYMAQSYHIRILPNLKNSYKFTILFSNYDNTNSFSMNVTYLSNGAVDTIGTASITGYGMQWNNSIETLTDINRYLVISSFQDSSQYYYRRLLVNYDLINQANIYGVAKESKSGGEKCIVEFGEVIGGFTALTKGSYYYVKRDGGLSTTMEDITDKAGIAISSTEMRWLKPKI